MHSISKSALALATLAALGLAAPQAAHAQAVTGTSTGVFRSVTAGSDNAHSYVPSGTFLGTKYGVGTNDLIFGAADPISNQFVFTGATINSTVGQAFDVGKFTFTNGTTAAGTNIDSADLKTTLSFSKPGIGTESFTYDIPLVSTLNNGTAAQNADYIMLPMGQTQDINLGGTEYALTLTGFDPNTTTANGFLTGSGGVGTSGTSELHVYEGGTASAGIMGRLTVVVPEPSSVAAFAFTGLGAAGLMLRARKRSTIA